MPPGPTPGQGLTWKSVWLSPPGRGRLAQPPEGGPPGVILPECLAPLQERGPQMGQSWQEPAASAHVPCRPGRGLPKTVVPLWPPRSTSFKLAIWFLPLACLGREQLRPLTSQFFLLTSVTQGLNCLTLPGGTWGRQA